MIQEYFEHVLESICARLTKESNGKKFATAAQFENRVREVLQDAIQSDSSIVIDFKPH